MKAICVQGSCPMLFAIVISNHLALLCCLTPAAGKLRVGVVVHHAQQSCIRSPDQLLWHIYGGLTAV